MKVPIPRPTAILVAKNRLRWWLVEKHLASPHRDWHDGQVRRRPAIEALLDGHEAWLDETASPYRAEYSTWHRSDVRTGWFNSGDAELLYSVVRRYRPRTVIEVGGGWTSRFIWRAMRKNGGGRLVSIDPQPRLQPPRGVERIRRKVEDVDPGLFDALGPNDVFFIDGGHSREEAEHEAALLRRLAPGVLVHHHDILYPYGRETPEETTIWDFYRNHRDTFRIRCAMAAQKEGRGAHLEALFPSFRSNHAMTPLSLWSEKVR